MTRGAGAASILHPKPNCSTPSNFTIGSDQIGIGTQIDTQRIPGIDIIIIPTKLDGSPAKEQ